MTPLRAFLTLFVVFALAATPTLAGKRVALVIGNSAYQNALKLPNPKNDASAVAASLERLDFQVVRGIDADYDGMEKALREFSRALADADLARSQGIGRRLLHALISYKYQYVRDHPSSRAGLIGSNRALIPMLTDRDSL